MAKIETPRFSSFLRRFFGMTGESQVADELAPEISAVLTLESARPEWEFLKGAKLMSCTATQVGDAGNPARIRIRNPALSGVVAIFDLIAVESSPTTIVLLERNTDNGSLATIFPTVSRDTRYPQLNASALVHSGGLGGSSGDSFFSGTPPAGNMLVIPVGPIVLTPGHQVQLSAVSNNIPIRASWQWLERPLDALERS